MRCDFGKNNPTPRQFCEECENKGVGEYGTWKNIRKNGDGDLESPVASIEKKETIAQRRCGEDECGKEGRTKPKTTGVSHVWQTKDL
jgi:hypothetical protein